MTRHSAPDPSPEPGSATQRMLDALRRARATTTCLRSPRVEHSPLPLELAYFIQQRDSEARARAGDPVIGYKVGATNRDAQSTLGLHTPIYGRIHASQQYYEPSPVSGGDYIAPRGEPEIALIVRDSLSAVLTNHPLHLPANDPVLAREIWAAVEVRLAFEIIDQRLSVTELTAGDAVADNAFGAGIYLGKPLEVSAAELEWHSITCTVVVDGGEATRPMSVGTSVAGGPLGSLLWLTAVLARSDAHLVPGTVVLTGTCATPIPLQGHRLIEADFAGVGGVTMHIADGAVTQLGADTSDTAPPSSPPAIPIRPTTA